MVRPSDHSHSQGTERRWSPAHLPDVRAELVDALRDVGSSNDPDLWSEGETPTATTARFRSQAGQLAVAEMYWATPDMTRVALDASTDLPEWTPAAILPAPIGLIVWDGGLPTLPLPGLPRDAWPPAGPLGIPAPPHAPVAGVLWAQYGGKVHVTALARTTHLAALSPLIHVPDVTLWPMVAVEAFDAGEVCTETDNAGDARGLIAALAATWILMQQPTVATPRQIGPWGKRYPPRTNRRARTPGSWR